MTIQELVDKLELKTFTGNVGMNNEIAGGYTSDLLSDVMGHSKEGQVWITLQTHRNIIGIASLKDLAAVILVKGFVPGDDTIELAEAEGVPLLGTPMQAFEVSGRIYELIR